MMTSDLKPCPFCGGSVTVHDLSVVDPVCFVFFAECDECGSIGPKGSTKSEAIAAWNCRAESRWVSVKERLPRRGRIVPACSKFFQYPCFVSDDDVWYYADGRIVESNSPILLWYDVPEPPEVSDE